jgi:hypothetical protein
MLPMYCVEENHGLKLESQFCVEQVEMSFGRLLCKVFKEHGFRRNSLVQFMCSSVP